MRLLSLVLVALAGGAAHTALAHTELAETVPADRATLESAPEDLMLRFSEPVRLTALSVVKEGGAKESLGPLPDDASAQFSVSVPALDDGHYAVSWRALSEDTHVMTGEFTFIVGALGDHEAPFTHADEADASRGSHTDHAGAH